MAAQKTRDGLTITPFTSADEIKCGLFVWFRDGGYNLKTDRPTLARGFIRNINRAAQVATISSKGSSYVVPLNITYIKAELTK